MSFLGTTSSELVHQFNTIFGRKYHNPPVVVHDPLIGLFVQHGNFRYIASSYTDAFKVAQAWAKRERPKSVPITKDSLLSLCTEFLTRLNEIKSHGATKGELASAMRFLTKAA
jgi:hypothetical protein